PKAAAKRSARVGPNSAKQPRPPGAPHRSSTTSSVHERGATKRASPVPHAESEARGFAMSRNRSGIGGFASSPILVGAVTVLVIIVAVFLAYNANNGLPFVSTYDLTARLPNADALVKGNEV